MGAGVAQITGEMMNKLNPLNILRTIFRIYYLLINIEKQIKQIRINQDIVRNDIVSIVNANKNKANLFIETENPLAINSDDHKFPLGTMNDNTRAPHFVYAIEQLLKKKCKTLDLGCSGGGLVYDFFVRGHDSYGIEGSDFSLKHQRAQWAIIPDRLFTADITKPFSFVNQSHENQKFDVITAWEVLEHLPVDLLPGFLDNIKKNLEIGGIFVASVAQFEDFNHETGAVYHVTLKSTQWWHDLFINYGFEICSDLLPISAMVRGNSMNNPYNPNDWDPRINPEMGFHLIVRNN